VAGRREGQGPWRTCVGCRARRPAPELLRLAAEPGGTGGARVIFDPKGQRPGRGAWICMGSPQCLAKAVAKGRLAKALRVTDPDLSDLARSSGLHFHRNGCQRDG
jgi:predicted RNA-binding protein YlxR (DUF448 family)